MQFSSEKIIILWNGWEVRLMVLLSLLLQIILIVFGARRKITRRTWIHILVWSAYMTADWVATVTLGNMARSQLGDSEYSSLGISNNLQAFWAPFLLLHLGGPDTITAYALEDNELWLRHFLGLVVQVGVAFYVFVRFWSNGALTYISILLFISGIIKYCERNFVLRFSSTQHFRDSLLLQPPDPCQEFVNIVDHEIWAEGSLSAFPGRMTKTYMVEVQDYVGPKDHYLVQTYFCFERFKYLYANLLLDEKERICIYSTIRDKSAVDAFKMVAVELGFIYDVFYTKAAIVCSCPGIFMRCISFICSLSALVLFSITIDVHAYSLTDVSITYVLLVGAVLLEIYAFILLVLSDWTKLWLIKLQKVTSKTVVEHFFRFCNDPALPVSNHNTWSGSIGQYNLISSCLRKVQPTYIEIDKLPVVGELLDQYWDRTWEDVNVNNLQETIFKFLKRHGDRINETGLVEEYNVLCELLLAQRGNLTLETRYGDDFWSSCFTVDMQFLDSLVIWHIATDLLYYNDLADIPEGDVTELDPKCKVSKYLSDYMLYLLVFCPFMLPQGFGVQRYKEARVEAMSLFKQKRPNNISKACKDLIEKYPQRVENRNFLTGMLIGGNISLLWHGCILFSRFQELTDIHRQIKWEVISEVWVEMLAYAACNCGWKEHAQQLRNGGEFLTHVYLVMAHFGLSRQYGGQMLMQLTSPSLKGDPMDTLKSYITKHRIEDSRA